MIIARLPIVLALSAVVNCTAFSSAEIETYSREDYERVFNTSLSSHPEILEISFVSDDGTPESFKAHYGPDLTLNPDIQHIIFLPGIKDFDVHLEEFKAEVIEYGVGQGLSMEQARLAAADESVVKSYYELLIKSQFKVDFYSRLENLADKVNKEIPNETVWNNQQFIKSLHTETQQKQEQLNQILKSFK